MKTSSSSSGGNVEFAYVVDADQVVETGTEIRSPFEVAPSAPHMEAAQYTSLGQGENASAELTPDAESNYRGKMESYNVANAVAGTNIVRRGALDIDEEAAALSYYPSKVISNSIKETINRDNLVPTNEVREYDPADSKYGDSKLDKSDYGQTDYAATKPNHEGSYTFSSENYKTKEYEFGSS